MTRGSSGAFAIHNGEMIEQGVHESDTVDAIGTRDAFIGGYLTQRIAHNSVEEALECATATASLKRTIKGDLAIITPDQVQRVIYENEPGVNRQLKLKPM